MQEGRALLRLSPPLTLRRNQLRRAPAFALLPMGSPLASTGLPAVARGPLSRFVGRRLVELAGFEPATSSMPRKRAPNCATAPPRSAWIIPSP